MRRYIPGNTQIGHETIAVNAACHTLQRSRVGRVDYVIGVLPITPPCVAETGQQVQFVGRIKADTGTDGMGTGMFLGVSVDGVEAVIQIGQLAPIGARDNGTVKRIQREISAQVRVAPVRPAARCAKLVPRVGRVCPQIPVLHGFGVGTPFVVAVCGEHVVLASQYLKAAGQLALRRPLRSFVVGKAVAAAPNGAAAVLPARTAAERGILPKCRVAAIIDQADSPPVIVEIVPQLRK